jgi:hypothetical protein
VIVFKSKCLQHSPSPSAARRGTRHTQMASWAHRIASRDRADSDEGRLPVILLAPKFLRHSPSPSATHRSTWHMQRGRGRTGQ